MEIMRRLTRWLDPKLDKYRVKPAKKPYTPKTLEEFIGVLQRTPRDVLSGADREKIAAIMSFDERKVGDLMVPRREMVFVKSDEVLGPLTLDKLYKSGHTSFPVVDGREKIVGMLNTEALNMLEIRETDKASKYMDKDVKYLKATDSLQFAVDEMKKRGGRCFLVKDESDEVAGFFTLEQLLDYLLG